MKPRLLDLFCLINCSSDKSDLPALRNELRGSTQDTEVLFGGVRESFSVGGDENAPMPPLRPRFRGVWGNPGQSTVLLQRVREERQRQENQHMARRTPRSDGDLSRESEAEESRPGSQAVARTPRAHPRSIRRGLRRVRRHQSVVASRGLHPNGSWEAVSAPSSLSLRLRAPRRIQNPLCQSSLRTHPYWAN